MADAGLSRNEREAVKQRTAELRAQEKAGKSRAAGEKAVREAIDAMPEADRILAEGIDRIVTEVAPHLVPKTATPRSTSCQCSTGTRSTQQSPRGSSGSPTSRRS